MINNYENNLQTIKYHLECGQRQFLIIFALCDSDDLRESIILNLYKSCTISIRRIDLIESNNNILSTIQICTKDELTEYLMICGLELIKDVETTLINLNNDREFFPKQPILIWINNQISNALFRMAPDFRNWSTVLIDFNNTDIISNQVKSNDTIRKTFV